MLLARVDGSSFSFSTVAARRSRHGLVTCHTGSKRSTALSATRGLYCKKGHYTSMIRCAQLTYASYLTTPLNRLMSSRRRYQICERHRSHLPVICCCFCSSSVVPDLHSPAGRVCDGSSGNARMLEAAIWIVKDACDSSTLGYRGCYKSDDRPWSSAGLPP